MKKVLSLALAFMLVILLIPAISVGARWSTETHSTIIGFSSADMLDDRDVEDFGRIVLGKDSQVLKIFMKTNSFDFGPGNPSDPLQVTQNLMGFLPLEFRWTSEHSKKASTDYASHVGGWVRFPNPEWFMAEYNADGITDPTAPQKSEAMYTLTSEGIGKVEMEIRVVFLNPDDANIVLAESDSIFMSGEYLDPTINKTITDLSGLSLTESGFVLQGTRPQNTIRLNDDIIPVSALGNLVIYPGDVIRIDLNTEHFIWSPAIERMSTSVRKSSLDNDHISVIRKVMKGNSLVESIAIENVGGAAEVVIRFIDTFNKVEEQEFSFDIGLGQYKKRNDATAVTISGTFGNEIYYVYESNDYIFTGDGIIAEAVNSVRNISIGLGEGVIVNQNLTEGGRYYGRATTAVDADSRAIMNYFPEIRKTISITSRNLESRARFVTFEKQETNYFVYDEDGLYLGRSAGQVEYRNRYFLSTKEIDFTADLIENMDSPQGEEIADNPRTGATGSELPIVLSLIAAFTVLAAGALALSKKHDEKN